MFSAIPGAYFAWWRKVTCLTRRVGFNTRTGLNCETDSKCTPRVWESIRATHQCQILARGVSAPDQRVNGSGR